MLSHKQQVLKTMKYKNMNTEQILNQIFHERNISERTCKAYIISMRYFENITCETLPTMLNIAETEEENNIRWKNCQLRKWLIQYRDWLSKKYKLKTLNLYLSTIIIVFRHHDITVEQLPYFSTKTVKQSEYIYPEDLPTKKIIKDAISMTSPLLRALILFMSSSGLSRADSLKLHIGDYLKATQHYHKTKTNIYKAIYEIHEHPEDVIPIFENLERQKTKQKYFTFCSPEAVDAINYYILTREEPLSHNTPLFRIEETYVNKLFRDLNDMMRLGRVNNTSRFSPHMLRRFHATQLEKSGLSSESIDLLQGRKPHGVAHQSYIRVSKSRLREEYIQALPYLMIEDINSVKTELEITKEENKTLKDREDKLKNIMERLERLEQME